MIAGLLGSPLRIAGIVAGVAVITAGAWYVWSAEAAKRRAAQLEQSLAAATETAEHNAEVARFLRADAEHTERLLARREREKTRLRRQVETMRGRLSSALEESSDAVQECMRVRLPDAVLDVLRRGAGKGGAEGGDAADPAAAAAGG